MDIQDYSRFKRMAVPKYDDGQARHGGLITRRDVLADMEEEIIDLWHYTQADRIRIAYPSMDDPAAIRNESMRRFDTVLTVLDQSAEGGVMVHPISRAEWLVIEFWQWVQARKRFLAERAKGMH